MNPKLSRVVDGLKAGAYKNIMVLTGAGVSCESGIPDFRSPGGLYKTLDPSLLTATTAQKNYLKSNPTGVVDIQIFSVNQFPYLEVRRPFILGTMENRWKPTIAHAFTKILEEKGLLKRVYDQNIDGLFHGIGLRPPILAKVHGSLAEVGCEMCGEPFPLEDFCTEVRTKIRNIYDATDPDAPSESTNICCLKCSRPTVKPKTVLFGRSLPEETLECMAKDFDSRHSRVPTSDEIDLLIISGTSLQVSPACNMVSMVPRGIPRVLINNECVGGNVGLDFDDPDNMDIWVDATSDRGFLDIALELGWRDELLAFKDLLCENSQRTLEQI